MAGADVQDDGDYKVGYGKPPVGRRFKKGQSGNPGGRAATTAPALLVRTLHEEVVVAAKGRREKTTRRESSSFGWPTNRPAAFSRCPRC